MEPKEPDNGHPGKVVNFLDARRRLIEEHGTASRGARSPLLEPIRKTLNSPDISVLFDNFIYHPDRNFDLIRNLIENHRIEATVKDIFQALAYLGIERLAREACGQYRPDYWMPAVETARAGTRLAIAAGDWSSAENLWLQLEECAMEHGNPDPKMQQQVLFELAGLLIKRGEFEGAVEFYLLCEKLAMADGDMMRVAAIQIQLGGVYLELDAAAEALNRFDCAAGIAREGGLGRDVIANIELGTAIALSKQREFKLSLRCLDRALKNADPVENPAGRIAILFHRSKALTELKRHEEALDSMLDAVRLAADSDDLDTRISLLYELFVKCLECDRWGEFLLELIGAMDRVHETEQFHYLGSLLMLSAKANSERGLFHLALHNLEEAAYLYQAFEDTERLQEVNTAIENLRSIISDMKNNHNQ